MKAAAGAAATGAALNSASAKTLTDIRDERKVEKSEMVLDQEEFEMSEHILEKTREFIQNIDAARIRLGLKGNEPQFPTGLIDVVEGYLDAFAFAIRSPGRRTNEMDWFALGTALQEARNFWPVTHPTYVLIKNMYNTIAAKVVLDSLRRPVPSGKPESDQANIFGEDS